MALSIKDAETDALARRLAAETGESITVAVRQALLERLERTRQPRARSGLAERLLRIGQQSAAHVRHPAHSLDHGELLYDEAGLPK